jgi:arsenite methyltransferase
MAGGVTPDPAHLREAVRLTYSKVADQPQAEHPFRVGREVAKRAGYSEDSLSNIPTGTLDAFAGISCLPCFAEIPTGARVLDLGCGAGLDSLLIASSAGSVVGIDFSTSMLAVARTSAESMGLTNVGFREGDAESIPLETGSVDVALVNGIFNLNPQRTAIFKELARVTRSGGVVFAAELVLKGPLPASESSESDWFS